MSTRAPILAGSFYPADKAELKDMISECLHNGVITPEPPKAMIAPHAGYIYSGKVAGSAYRGLEQASRHIRRVVLFGPSHRVGFKGLALPSVSAFDTPLGRIPLDKRAMSHAVKMPHVQVMDKAHEAEHSLEVQLPFLQSTLRQFMLLPFCVGDATIEHVSEVMETFWGGPETLILVSSDLSHFHDYDTCNKVDGETSEKILAQNPVLEGQNACGARAINGLLHTTKKLGLEPQLIDINNSGDTAGSHDKTRVVGYGAYYIGKLAMDDINYSLEMKQELIVLARSSVQYGLTHQAPMPNFKFPTHLASKVPMASFVTINKNGALRGCIGALEAHQPLALDVMYNAFKAAFRDPRFPPISESEWEECDIHISILTPPSPITFSSEADLLSQIRPHIDGLILQEGNKRSTFLPHVWESLPEKEEFLGHLKQKAGLPSDYWSSTLQISRYTTESFGEEVLQ